MKVFAPCRLESGDLGDIGRSGDWGAGVDRDGILKKDKGKENNSRLLDLICNKSPIDILWCR